MGETVYVHSAEPAQPLHYADPKLMSPWAMRLMGVLRRMGGVRQIVFALGLASLCAAAALVFGPNLNSELCLFFSYTGGLLTGMVVRVPLVRD